MTTTIGPNTRIEGRVEGDADLEVAGAVSGTIDISEALTIIEGGFVSGDVTARDVRIDGAFEGTLNVSGVLHLTASANVKATIETAALIVDDGAAIAGDVTMDVEGDVPRPTSRANAPARTSSSSSSSTNSSTPARSAQGTQAATETTTTTTTTTVVEEEEDESEHPTAADLTAAMMEEQTVKELREQLRELDLPVSGTKAELIERLQEAGGE